jgi:hypothetical protein
MCTNRSLGPGRLIELGKRSHSYILNVKAATRSWTIGGVKA